MNKVYILRGSQGSYDDHEDWIVAVYSTKEAAEARLELCQTFADSLEDVASNYGKQSPHDPHYYKGYYSVVYVVDTYNLIEDISDIVYEEKVYAEDFAWENAAYTISHEGSVRSLPNDTRMFKFYPISSIPKEEFYEISITVREIEPTVATEDK